jgi:prevent-host-death family protein
MTSTISQVMESITVHTFQENFDELMERVENGESFIITGEHGDVIIVPYEHYNEDLNFFSDHNDGC